MSCSEFLEFRMEGKILAQFLTALIFGSLDQAKEHTLKMENVFIWAWRLFQQTLSSKEVIVLFACKYGIILKDIFK
jgi:hypothetical protein